MKEYAADVDKHIWWINRAFLCCNKIVYITGGENLQSEARASTVVASNTDLLLAVATRRHMCGITQITKIFVVTLKPYRKVWFRVFRILCLQYVSIINCNI